MQLIAFKKKNVFIVLILAAAFLSVAIWAAMKATSQAAGGYLYIGAPVVVIDAGHGGRDGGAIGKTTKVKESDLNLAIAKKLESHLVRAGFNVVQTRPTKDGLYGPLDKNRKMADMKKRKSIIEKASPDAIVSIHQNSFPLASERGFQTFYLKGSIAGAALAERVQSEALARLPEARRAAKTGDYYMLECSSAPTIIAECGFVTNPEEERLLQTREYQEKVAYTIFCGLLKYLNFGVSMK